MDLWVYIALFVLLDLLVLFYVLFLRKVRGMKASDHARFLQHWRRIAKDKDLKRAVIESDKLLDEILKTKGYRGPLGEKLKQCRSLFSHNDDVWSAHKLRNRLAHELNVKISDHEAATALKQFKKAFKDLGLSL